MRNRSQGYVHADLVGKIHNKALPPFTRTRIAKQLPRSAGTMFNNLGEFVANIMTFETTYR
jgi:hypothetical protein